MEQSCSTTLTKKQKTNSTMKHAIIVGATSGIGKEVAKLLVQQGWHIGIAGRRTEALKTLQTGAPTQIDIQQIDVTDEDAPARLQQLIERLGDMDLFLLSSGVGFQNRDLNPETELDTARTNVEGFIRMVTCAFNYFKKRGCGHIAVISSIAGTKGLGVAPSYSATKRFQNTYIDALAQLSGMQHLNIHFTDIRPGFVATDLLRNGKYPMLMQADSVARHIVNALHRKKRIAVIDLPDIGILLADDSTMVMGKVAHKELISYLHATKHKQSQHEKKFKTHSSYSRHRLMRRFHPTLPCRKQHPGPGT